MMEEIWRFNAYDDRGISVKEFLKFVLAFVITMKLIGLLFPVCIVKGQSMKNTLQDKDLVVLNRLSYFISEPKRKDIVIINVDENNSSEIAGKTIVKRIIGLPGEKLEIKENKIYINGEYIEEGYLYDDMITPNIDVLIPLKEVFVMGDNRNKSGDSRDFGTFRAKDIEAKVLFKK